MSTVAEAIMSQDTEYTMPEAWQGMCVTFYLPHVIDGAPPVIGWVKAIPKHSKTVSVVVPDVGRFTSVRHISDPKLKKGPEFREDGAWDYSPEVRRTEERFTALEQLVEKLLNATIPPVEKRTRRTVLDDQQQ